MTSFAANIRPLFRPDDLDAMQGWFDLSNYQEVRDNAEAIYERLSEGSMPCDGPWPAEQVARFREWIDSGFPE